MNRFYLRWFLLVGTLYTTIIFLWLILTPSLSEDVFFLWYSFERFFLNTSVGFVLIAGLIGLFLINTRWLNNLFSRLMDSQVVFWFVFVSFIITLTILLFGAIFIVFGYRSVIFEQVIPLIALVYLFLFEIILFQHTVSEGKITQPVWGFVVLTRYLFTSQFRKLSSSLKILISHIGQFISDLIKIIRLYTVHSFPYLIIILGFFLKKILYTVVHSFRYLFIILRSYRKKITILSILHGLDYFMYTLLTRLNRIFSEK